jgi:hypothetical protein
MECDAELVEDTETVARMGASLMTRYGGDAAHPDDPPPAELTELVAKQAPKRVGLVFRPTRVVSWDHTKLGGVY